MIRRPPRSTRTDTLFPYTTLFRSVVIDNSSAFRYDDDVPLVVAEVNPEAMANRPRGIIANPNCSTMQLLVALAPIHHAVGIERINVATYQSVSGAGRSAMEELGKQRSEERRVGKECVRTCRSRWSPDH